LIDLRSKLFVELKNYDLEAEQKMLEEKMAAHKGGRKANFE